MKQRHLDRFRATRQQPGEEILAYGDGQIGNPLEDGVRPGGDGMLILTDRRLVFLSSFLFREVCEEMPLARIYEIEYRSVLGYHTLEFKTPDGSFFFRSSSKDSRDTLLKRAARLLDLGKVAPREVRV
ncbi:MAG: PH domain-containing protein [Magnetospirillum sp. WYHS-4]